MASTNVWNIFLPVNLLADSPVLLTGHIIETSVFVTDTRSKFGKSDCHLIIGEFTTSKTRNQIAPSQKVSGGTVWLSVSRSSENVLESRLYRPGAVDSCRCVTVLFDPKDLLSSFVFTEENGNCTDSTCVSRLFHVYKAISDNSKQKHRTARNHSRKLIEQTFSCCLKILILIFTFVEILLRLITFKWCWSRICILAPAIMNNITYKLNRFKRVQLLTAASKHRSKLMLFDTCGQQLLDTMLGVFFMLLVMCHGHADMIASSLMHWADDTANYLNDLLHWLMGAPAGLKLNTQLTQYMGHFFLYHVYLWSGYLSILRPVLGWVVWVAASFGTLGLTTQLCLVQDIISMLTLHIYCFYVYAARLYRLQAYALSSLWRLFRGKKWNVLRLRVDSALYTIDQLCVGTLLFTVLLFLLPTTLLYYCVFITLRLLVLSFHGMLAVVTDVLNGIPPVSLLLRVIRSKFVAGDVLFTVVHSLQCLDSDSCFTLSMQVIQLPLLELYHRAQILMKTDPDKQEHQKYSWAELLQRVVSGNLVYPWVNPYSTNSKEKEL